MICICFKLYVGILESFSINQINDTQAHLDHLEIRQCRKKVILKFYTFDSPTLLQWNYIMAEATAARFPLAYVRDVTFPYQTDPQIGSCP